MASLVFIIVFLVQSYDFWLCCFFELGWILVLWILYVSKCCGWLLCKCNDPYLSSCWYDRLDVNPILWILLIMWIGVCNFRIFYAVWGWQFGVGEDCEAVECKDYLSEYCFLNLVGCFDLSYVEWGMSILVSWPFVIRIWCECILQMCRLARISDTKMKL